MPACHSSQDLCSQCPDLTASFCQLTPLPETPRHSQEKMSACPSTLPSWQSTLSNSMKLWAMPCKSTQDGWVIVESSEKMWSSEEGNGKHLQHSYLETPLNNMKRQKDMTLKDELSRSVGSQYVTGEERKNTSRRNDKAEPKQKQCPFVDVSDGENKVWYCKEQYCIGTWNVRSINQGKLEVVKQEMVRVSINILGIGEIKWTGWVNLIQMTIISTIVGKNTLEEWSSHHSLQKSKKCSTWVQSQKW